MAEKQPTPEMQRHARKHQEVYLKGLHPDSLATLSDHDKLALKEAIAWALLRWNEHPQEEELGPED